MTLDLMKIDPAVLKCWQRSFPDINVVAEIGFMDAWIKSNPSKAPKKDVLRFANSWLKKEQRKYLPTPHLIGRMRKCIEQVSESYAGSTITDTEWVEALKRRCAGDGLTWTETLMREALKS